MKREITGIDFGRWLHDMRRKRKLRQTDLARLSKCHETSISRWETGDATPTLEQAEKLVKILGAELVIREKGYDEGEDD